MNNMKLNQFTIDDTTKCKGIAIMLMLFHHMFRLPKSYAVANYTLNFFPFSEYTFLNMGQFSKVCVGIFAFLSAYGLTLSYSKWKYSNSRFVIYRYFKMMIDFFAVFIMMIITTCIVKGNFDSLSVYGKDKPFSFAWQILIDMLGLSKLLGTGLYDGTWWYMSLAILIIVIVPLLFKLCDKAGSIIVLSLSLCLPIALGVKTELLVRWLFCITLGIVFAKKELFTKIKEKFSSFSFIIKTSIFIFGCELMFVLYQLRKSNIQNDFIAVWDAIIPLAIILLAFLYINRIPVISHILNFLGKYSMLMFLTHTFLRVRWYKPFAYPTEYAIIDYVFFLIASLILAIIIDYFLKICRFYKLKDRILLIILTVKKPKQVVEEN